VNIPSNRLQRKEAARMNSFSDDGFERQVSQESAESDAGTQTSIGWGEDKGPQITLTLEEGLAAMDELIAQLESSESQMQLAELYGRKPMLAARMISERKKLTNTYLIPVITKYGFDPDETGAARFTKMFSRPPFKRNKQAQERHEYLHWLLRLEEENFHVDSPLFGRKWKVVSVKPVPVYGTRQMGAQNSPKIGELTRETIIEEFGREGNLIRFRHAKAPIAGWVQIEDNVNGRKKLLLQPVG